MPRLVFLLQKGRVWVPPANGVKGYFRDDPRTGHAKKKGGKKEEGRNAAGETYKEVAARVAPPVAGPAPESIPVVTEEAAQKPKPRVVLRRESQRDPDYFTMEAIEARRDATMQAYVARPMPDDWSEKARSREKLYRGWLQTNPEAKKEIHGIKESAKSLSGPAADSYLQRAEREFEDKYAGLWLESRRAAAMKIADALKDAPQEIFIQKHEAKTEAAKNKALDGIPEKEGYEVVYKPYGEQGRGFYYNKKGYDK
jgi:hypothetical protein